MCDYITEHGSCNGCNGCTAEKETCEVCDIVLDEDEVVEARTCGYCYLAGCQHTIEVIEDAKLDHEMNACEDCKEKVRLAGNLITE